MRIIVARLIGVVIHLIVLLSTIYDCKCYKTLTIEDDDLCSEVQQRRIKLGKGSKSGLIVKQSRLNDHALPWPTNLRCSFRVEAYSDKSHFPVPFWPINEKDGVFGVIQNLNFRKNDTTNECIDYVQFTNNESQSSRKYCGVLNTALIIMESTVQSRFIENEEFGGFRSKKELKVTIFISKDPLREDEEMDLNIVFTSYRDCFRERSDRELLPCSDRYNLYCIYEGFFNDGYVNCPYKDCLDEGGCSIKDDTPQRQSTGTKVLIGSVGSLFLAFAIFVCCLWVCRKHKVFCWADEFAYPSTPAPTPSTRVEMSEQSLSPSTANQTIASTSPSAPDEDKDLPPSYESLFPSR